ncbi:MAG TPA: hypothetical protein VM241_07960 [Candidatus Thermoplasmatota archaeon]|nr:hypothetical protein [Candidatus Thermoplasmatota archaeon]
MKTRSALAAAIACGAAAVALVGADLALNVDVTFEVLSGGAWVPVQSTKDMEGRPYAVRGPGCGQDFRLTAHNGMPWSSSLDITLLRDGANPWHLGWTLSAGETRSTEVFHLNATAPAPAGGAKSAESIQVQVGRDFSAYGTPCPEAVR